MAKQADVYTLTGLYQPRSTMDKLLKGAVDTLPATKELIEVQEALPLPEPESGGVSVGTGLGIAALVLVLVAAFAKYKCKCKK